MEEKLHLGTKQFRLLLLLLDEEEEKMERKEGRRAFCVLEALQRASVD